MKTLRAITTLIISVSTIIFSQTAVAPDSGDGSSGNPYHIASLGNLYWIAANSTRWNKYYIQTANINASETRNWSGGGWTPIGNNSPPFTGTYNGQKYIIDSLFISRSSNSDYYQGLFGYTYNSTIKNVCMTNADITGYSYVGAVIGRSGISTASNGGTITDCNSTGIVYAKSSYSGGIIGISYKSTIERCYSTCTVTGAGSSVLRNGGLLGRAEGGTIVNNCYSRGTVFANAYCGGLIGSNNGAIITNCYSTGTMSGYSYVGGLIGEAVSGSVDSCLWDTQTSGRSSSAGGTGKTTSEMQTVSTFTNAGWDFTDVWEMVGTNYPRLKSNQETALPVELISFIASPKNNVVELKWTTTTEVNNYGFEIEKKSIKDELGSVKWEQIGFVEGSGTTQAPKQYSFVDKNVLAGKYLYRLKQIDRDGKFIYSNEVEILIAAPKEFSLSQNYPNPFNPTTVINYQIPISSRVILKVFDPLGKEVTTLVNEMKDAGTYSVQWNAASFGNGIYFYQLITGEKTFVKKMVLMK